LQDQNFVGQEVLDIFRGWWTEHWPLARTEKSETESEEPAFFQLEPEKTKTHT